MFAVETTHDADAATVTASGDLDVASAPGLAEALDSVIDSGVAVVRCDLAGVGFIDSSGLSALLSARNRLVEGGRRFVVARPGDQASMLFRVTGTDAVLEVETD